PALLAWAIFEVLRRVSWRRHPWLRTCLVAVSLLGWTLCLVYGVVLLFNRNPGASRRALDITFQQLTLAAALVLCLSGGWSVRPLENDPEFALGLFIGQLSALATSALACVALAFGAVEPESWQTMSQLLFVAHVPVALLEGVILGFTISFL